VGRNSDDGIAGKAMILFLLHLASLEEGKAVLEADHEKNRDGKWDHFFQLARVTISTGVGYVGLPPASSLAAHLQQPLV
jgi:hypothetical protein